MNFYIILLLMIIISNLFVPIEGNEGEKKKEKKTDEDLEMENKLKTLEDEKKKADAKFKKDFAKSLERGTVTQKALPLYKAGGPFVPDKTVDKRTGKKVEPMEKKPYMGKATVPDTSEKEPIPADTGAGDPKEVKKTKKKFSDFSKKIQSLKKDQGKAKQAVVDVDTDKFFKDVEKRKQTGFDNLRKAIQTGTTKSGESIDKIDREGTRDISTMTPSERERAFGSSGSTEGGAGGAGPKRQDSIVKSNKPFKKFKSELPLSPSEVFTGSTTVDCKISKPKKQRAPITRGRARKDNGLAPRPEPPVKIEKKPSAFAQAVKKADKFVQKNPVIGGVTGLAAYDLGKGVLGKILNIRKLTPGVVGGTVGRRSARGGRGL